MEQPNDEEHTAEPPRPIYKVEMPNDILEVRPREIHAFKHADEYARPQVCTLTLKNKDRQRACFRFRLKSRPSKMMILSPSVGIIAPLGTCTVRVYLKAASEWGIPIDDGTGADNGWHSLFLEHVLLLDDNEVPQMPSDPKERLALAADVFEVTADTTGLVERFYTKIPILLNGIPGDSDSSSLSTAHDEHADDEEHGEAEAAEVHGGA